MRLSFNFKVGLLAATIAALGVSSALLINSSLRTMSSDGRVVNFTGIVRGASQRLVKLEMAGKKPDALRQRISAILAGLQTGSKELELPAATTPKFLGAVQAAEVQWVRLGEAIDAHRAAAEKVAKIAGSIDEIAFQTNLLALNAAVEAARAGESGQGFAVVADEVRNLAQRAAAAAKESSASIDEAIRSSETGAVSAAKVSESLAHLESKIREIDVRIDKIAAAADDQMQGIKTVRDAIRSIDGMTQGNAAAAEEEAAAAEELQAQAKTLQDHAATLLELVEGTVTTRANRTGNPSAPAPAAPQIGGPRQVRPVAAESMAIS